MNDRIAVLIPVTTKPVTIAKVVDDFRRALPEATVYVYDNNSSDDTSAIAAAHGAVVRFEPRQGKGNVVRQMFRDIEADCYLMVDGDDTYPAEAARGLCEPILSGKADMTVGDRLSNGTYAEENKRAFHGFGNNLVRAMIKWIYGYGFEDVMTGYRAFSPRVCKDVPRSPPKASKLKPSSPSTRLTVAGASRMCPSSTATVRRVRSPSSLRYRTVSASS